MAMNLYSSRAFNLLCQYSTAECSIMSVLIRTQNFSLNRRRNSSAGDRHWAGNQDIQILLVLCVSISGTEEHLIAL